ncbi:hypothetical protein TRICI_003967 [Trichomonascus ciferrii]|uniref:Uncharacterized protein n=1 Tax=Trichomonascus ciferrii TaxID=44093 RepID=A0A642V7C3_9ASCO|nr:hypothetical protein TRICI_003967 [Trichomonascus ciferrii]
MTSLLAREAGQPTVLYPSSVPPLDVRGQPTVRFPSSEPSPLKARNQVHTSYDPINPLNARGQPTVRFPSSEPSPLKARNQVHTSYDPINPLNARDDSRTSVAVDSSTYLPLPSSANLVKVANIKRDDAEPTTTSLTIHYPDPTMPPVAPPAEKRDESSTPYLPLPSSANLVKVANIEENIKRDDAEQTTTSLTIHYPDPSMPPVAPPAEKRDAETRTTSLTIHNPDPTMPPVAPPAEKRDAPKYAIDKRAGSEDEENAAPNAVPATLIGATVGAIAVQTLLLL